MQKLKTLILSVILPVFIAGAVQAEDVVKKPKLSIATPSFDFGTVTEGAKIEHSFIIKNDGDTDLTIQKVVASCGCTASKAKDSLLMPGASTEVRASFDSKGFSGEQTKIIRVISNDPENGITNLTLKGKVEPKIEISPTNVFFETIKKTDGELSREVKVEVRKGENIQLEKVESFSKFLKVEELSGSSEKTKLLKVSLIAKPPVGDFRDRIVVALKGSSRNSLSIPVFGNVVSDFMITPPSVSFGVLSGKEVMRKEVKIESNSAEPVRVEDVEVSDPAVKAKVEEVQSGKVYRILLEIDPKTVKKDIRASIKILTDSKNADNLTFNVYGILPVDYK